MRIVGFQSVSRNPAGVWGEKISYINMRNELHPKKI